VTPLGKCGHGICMDINPKQFKSPFGLFEFGTYHCEQETDILLLSMNWLFDLNPCDLEPNKLREEEMQLMNYWAFRLSPLIKNKKKPTVVCISNRIGLEENVQFAGTSCILHISNQKVSLIGHLTAIEQSCLVCDLDL
jgi:protein N-terminal amidase